MYRWVNGLQTNTFQLNIEPTYILILKSLLEEFLVKKVLVTYLKYDVCKIKETFYNILGIGDMLCLKVNLNIDVAISLGTLMHLGKTYLHTLCKSQYQSAFMQTVINLTS